MNGSVGEGGGGRFGGFVESNILMPIKLPISKRETNFLANSGGNGWYGGRVEWRDLTALKIWKAR